MLRAPFALLLLAAGAAPSAAHASSPPEDHPEPYLVRDLAPGPEGLGPRFLWPLGDGVLGWVTEIDEGASFSPAEWPYRSDLSFSDGTPEGTVFPLLPEGVHFAWWWPGSGSYGINFFGACEAPLTVVDGCGFFLNELWRTDGTPEGTFPLTGPGGVDRFGRGGPDGLYVEERGLLFFRGAETEGNEGHGYELWVSDGTREGTRLLADLDSEGSSFPGSMVELDSVLYFRTTPAGGLPFHWGRSDGTPEGTRLLPRPFDGRAHARELVAGDDEVFAFFWIPDEGMTLWREDGSGDGLELLADLGPVPYSGLSIVGIDGGKIFFQTGEPSGFRSPRDAHLWVSDGTAEGTRRIPRPPGTVLRDGFSYHSVRVLGERAYFGLDDGVHGLEPWVSDGTVEGTRMIHDLCPGPCDGRIFGFQGFLDEVHLLGNVFEASGDSEPLVYDPETGELRELGDLCPGECVATGFVLEEVGRLAYWVLDDGTHGSELWVSDGTEAGTARISDFERSQPFLHQVHSGYIESTHATVAGDRLFFGAGDGIHGWELWALPLPAEGTEFPPRPPEAPLTSPELPGFAVWVRITPGAEDATPGRNEADCIPETLCVSGAVPGRSEVFVRVVGPKPNGRLWPTLVKFTTSTVEVWIEQLATGTVRYYRLEGASPGSSELPGLFDRDGFPPV